MKEKVLEKGMNLCTVWLLAPENSSLYGKEDEELLGFRRFSIVQELLPESGLSSIPFIDGWMDGQMETDN